ncbi:MAG TPA: DUF559 domain-containing protein [Burkholderiales bacterium]|nr:DUF559 domain-containing protein [Burkholderiales bacterium]
MNRQRSLRRNQTDAEKLLWFRLRNRQIGGAKFRRQHPIGPYIVDLVCVEAGLVVEIDGGQHATEVQADSLRTSYLEEHGFRVVRFWNNDVFAQTDALLERIREMVSK